MFHELRSNAKIEKLFEKLTTMTKDGSALLKERSPTTCKRRIPT